MNRNLEMRDEKIDKLLWKFSLPAIIGMLVNALYNIVDRIFVGQGVGYIGIAATTVAFPIMIINMATSMLIAIGATALISIRLGEQKKEEAEKIAGNATGLLILLPLLLTIVYLIFTDPILKLFGASAEVLPYARDFTHIIMLGSVSGSIAFGMNNFIRAEGNPRYAMLTQIIGAVLNVILNYTFIFKLGLGIKGSALASICSQTVSALFVLGYYFTNRSTIKIHLRNLKPQPSIVFSILVIGFAPFAMQIANSIQQTILNKTLMVYGGDIALSAVGIIMSISTIIFMPIVGISQGAQPLIGFNYGAKQYDRIKETLKKSVLFSTILAVVGYVVIRIWPYQIIGLFSKDDVALTQLTVHAMLVFFALLPLIGIQILCSSYFQAVGKPLQSTLLNLSRQVLLFIPLLLILPNFWGIEGVWRTAPIADSLAVLITSTVILFEMKKLPKSVPIPQESV
ncbi:putative MATE family efflux protein [Desulfitobacterium sp. LBE]|uniref:Multidrug export protein MepA n=4 Tax=Desulfitobacterium hafniense TaxID=49338 RepID=Q24R50_DESHY|nr:MULTISPECIES: MATE family efflux transporter [Desulfitobacterium]ACL19698.1 MATE efflux family protein [Desulfitobacterium hafniense DCB-2]EHL08307.1 MATE efflux family protein [Desulfitobacterium hafniense DP7]KTE89620.1 MATE family efflux transporter [Desulfitobacterium hafniense]TWH57453.1 putative MATE family efflux protein [Desulfitobacterium sp. LBE]CDX03868.1 Multidrug export protein MepA [Desulfitobacterium hafniense]